MRASRFILAVGSLLLFVGCGAPNSIPINAGNCGPGSYPNEPCVSVTVCAPGSGSCATIDNVLLDTGSYGLRIFASVAPANLVPVTDSNGGAVAECSPFADGSSEWGSVRIADVKLGGEKAASVPIQVVDSTYAQIPSTCTNPDTTPAASGYNGILGVGPSTQDCGATCSESASAMYYSCGGGICQATAVPLNQQVSNPIAFLPVDNNGISIQMPAISANGSGSVSGTLLLGIGTQSNNRSQSTVYLPSDSGGNFTTTFNGNTYTQSFIDSGSNAYFFPATSQTPDCPAGGSASGLYCPPTELSLIATQAGYERGTAASVTFNLIPALAALSSSNRVFNDLGGDGSGGFDFGMPFFFGRTVYVIMTGRTAPMGPGPGWAY